MTQQYTNELTPEILAGMGQSPFTPEQLAVMGNEGRARIEEQKTFCLTHPVKAIYRIAVDGSLTQRGGVVRAAWNGAEIGLTDGRRVNIALEGDEVVYSDGTTARIVTGSGKDIAKDGRGIALVDSMLSNGDRIISTPQSANMLVERDGVPMGEEFLAEGV